jgi:hypothetical protein
MSLRDRIKNESQNSGGGFRPHPLGNYPGVVEEVREKTLDSDQVVYDIVVRTAEGIAKVGVFKTTVADVEDGYGGKLDRAAAEDRYVKSIGRVCRLYRDLGLEEPDGGDELELEAATFARLGELVGRVCEVSVQPNRRKPGDVVVYINAPAGGKGPVVTPTGARAAPTFGGGLEDLPF